LRHDWTTSQKKKVVLNAATAVVTTLLLKSALASEYSGLVKGKGMPHVFLYFQYFMNVTF
jgi:hypothetical protein